MTIRWGDDSSARDEFSVMRVSKATASRRALPTWRQWPRRPIKNVSHDFFFTLSLSPPQTPSVVPRPVWRASTITLKKCFIATFPFYIALFRRGFKIFLPHRVFTQTLTFYGRNDLRFSIPKRICVAWWWESLRRMRSLDLRQRYDDNERHWEK